MLPIRKPYKIRKTKQRRYARYLNYFQLFCKHLFLLENVENLSSLSVGCDTAVTWSNLLWLLLMSETDRRHLMTRAERCIATCGYNKLLSLLHYAVRQILWWTCHQIEHTRHVKIDNRKRREERHANWFSEAQQSSLAFLRSHRKDRLNSQKLGLT